MKRVRILSWNINGIRAVLKKDFLPWLQKQAPDVICLQETKAHPGQLAPEILYPPGYHAYWNSAERPGYSGVATLSREKPVGVKPGLGVARFDREGRVLLTEFPRFTLLNIYFPNGGMSPERLRYKMDFYEESLRYFVRLTKKGKRLVISGDYNTAHKPIDLKRPRENEDVSGFLPMEREWMDRLVAAGFIDTFRVLHPDEPDQYSWWDMRTAARARNIGWRIDYHFISENLRPYLNDALIMPEVTGSDHCPVGLVLRFS